MTSTPPLFVTYPLTTALAPLLDELAEIVGATREQAALYALASVILISHCIKPTMDVLATPLGVSKALRRTPFGESELNPMLVYQLAQNRTALSNMRIIFSANCSLEEFDLVRSTIAEWFGCLAEDVLVYSVAWVLEEVKLVRRGGSLLLRDTLGTEVVIYDSRTASKALEWAEKWERGGGKVETVGRWDSSCG